MSDIKPEVFPTPEQDFVPDVLPAVENTAVEKQAITERILDRVIDAAEHDEPLEREFERSHEVKDKTPLNPPNDNPMQSIGSILHQQQAQNAAPTPVQPYNNQFAEPVNNSSQSRLSSLSNLSYASAIKIGVISALTFSVMLGLIAVIN